MTKNNRRNLSVLLLAAFMLALLSGCQQTASLSANSQLSTNAVATIKSIEKIADNFYRVDYLADYALDELLLEGTADQKELDRFISRKLLDGLPFHADIRSMGCSTFSAATPDGDYIQGRNMDLADAQYFIVRTRPANGYESLSMVTGLPLGYVDGISDSLIARMLLLAAPYYPTDGINEKGLSVAVLLLQDTPVQQSTGKIPITTMLAIRMMLDKTASVEEAVALLNAYDMRSIYAASYHFHIADAYGKSAVIEYVDNQMRVIRPAGYGQVATNFFLSPDKYDTLSDGKDRLAKLQAALDENKGIVTPQKAWQMLKSVELTHDYDQLTGIDFNTAYSIIYNNSKRTMAICIDANFDAVHNYKVGGDF